MLTKYSNVHKIQEHDSDEIRTERPCRPLNAGEGSAPTQLPHTPLDFLDDLEPLQGFSHNVLFPHKELFQLFGNSWSREITRCIEQQKEAADSKHSNPT